MNLEGNGHLLCMFMLTTHPDDVSGEMKYILQFFLTDYSSMREAKRFAK